MPIKKTVRVATSNNFNCTSQKFKQLKKMEEDNPDSIFFVNVNINTPDLLKLNEHNYKVVVTINPTLIIRKECVERFFQLRKDMVAFVRVKYLPEHPEINDLVTRLAKDNYAVVVTVQRWNSKETLLNWTKPEYYAFSHSRYRLAGSALKEVQDFVDSFDKEKVYLCDRIGVGCRACLLCIMLTSGVNTKLASVNLSNSGVCPFNCPDCYAKKMQEMSKAFGYKVIDFDNIKANSKQAGQTQHIKDTLKDLGV